MAMDSVSLGLAAAALGGVQEAKDYTDTKLGAVSTNVEYKGHVDSASDLPASPTVGDEYDVGTTGLWLWNGTSWTRANEQGPQGETGASGTAAGFGAPIASAESVEYGQPATASVTASGPDTEKIFSFAFEIPKGQDGANIVSVSATGTSTNKVKYITIDGTESKMGMDVINNVTSTSTEAALSANMGKELQDQISNLKNIGRFLAIWNCSTGLPLSNPTTLPYTYKTGDYYRVGTVAGTYTHSVSMSGTDEENETFNVTFSFTDETSTAYSTVAALSDALYAQGHTGHSGTCPATGSASGEGGSWTIGYVASDAGTNVLLQDSTTSARGTVLDSATGITLTDTVTGSATNYKPNGATYTGTASSTVETEDVEVGWVYYFDGNQWLAQSAGGGGLVQDVQINGTTILDLNSGIANIPTVYSASDGYGVVRVSTTYGIGCTSGGTISINAVTDNQLVAKTDGFHPIVSSKLDKAVMEGLGNNSLTWSDAYKTAARNTIGAIALEEYDSTATPAENTLYYVIED